MIIEGRRKPLTGGPAHPPFPGDGPTMRSGSTRCAVCGDGHSADGCPRLWRRLALAAGRGPSQPRRHYCCMDCLRVLPMAHCWPCAAARRRRAAMLEGRRRDGRWPPPDGWRAIRRAAWRRVFGGRPGGAAHQAAMDFG